MNLNCTSVRFSFSTLGCPGWGLGKILEAASAYGYSGIDFRGCGDELDIRKLPEFSDKEITSTAMRIKDCGIEVSGLSSSCSLLSKNETAHNVSLSEFRDYVWIATKLGCKFIRIFPGYLDGRSYADALSEAASHLREVASIADAAGVMAVVETHDDWVSTRKIAELFDTAGNPSGCGILWDTHNPYRISGESVEESISNIGNRVVYTHWKDSLPSNDGKSEGSLKIPGEGDVPIKQMFDALVKSGYHGWITFEWEKRWHSEIPEPEYAFPAFLRLMSTFG